MKRYLPLLSILLLLVLTGCSAVYQPVYDAEEHPDSDAVWAESGVSEEDAAPVRALLLRFFSYRAAAIGGEEFEPDDDSEIDPSVMSANISRWADDLHQSWEKEGLTSPTGQITYAVQEITPVATVLGDSYILKVAELLTVTGDGDPVQMVTLLSIYVDCLSDGTLDLNVCTTKNMATVTPIVTEGEDASLCWEDAALDEPLKGSARALLEQFLERYRVMSCGGSYDGPLAITQEAQEAADYYFNLSSNDSDEQCSDAGVEYELQYVGTWDGTVTLYLSAELSRLTWSANSDLAYDWSSSSYRAYKTFVLRLSVQEDGSLLITEVSLPYFAVDTYSFLTPQQTETLRQLAQRYADGLLSVLTGGDFPSDEQISPAAAEQAEQWADVRLNLCHMLEVDPAQLTPSVERSTSVYLIEDFDAKTQCLFYPIKISFHLPGTEEPPLKSYSLLLHVGVSPAGELYLEQLTGGYND